VAVWQAIFQLVPTRGFPADYHDLLGDIAPRIRSWSRDIEWWGSEDGDRIDVLLHRGLPVEGLVRIDLREPDAKFIEEVLRFAADAGFRFRDEYDWDVEPNPTAFALALRRSQAARFVEDPARYLTRLRDAGSEDA
jgi:hypothetical protein